MRWGTVASEPPGDSDPRPRMWFALVEGVVIDRDIDCDALVARIKASGYLGHVLVVPEPEVRR